MNTGVISMRYAHALFDFAKVQGCADELYSQMNQLSLSYKDNHELNKAMVNPVIPLTEKTDLILIAANAQMNECFKKFVQLVIKKNRADLFQFMAHAYITLYRKEHNIKAAKFITAVPIPESYYNKIKHEIENKYNVIVELTTYVDPKIEGGFIYEVDSMLFDASILNQLRIIKKQFIERNRRIV